VALGAGGADGFAFPVSVFGAAGLDVVLAVAVGADRGVRVVLPNRLPVNAGLELSEDAQVTASADVRNVETVNGRFGIEMALDGVAAVAILADRRPFVTGLQRFAVDALQVEILDIYLRRSGDVALIVTARAVDFANDPPVRYLGDIGVAIGTELIRVYRSLKILRFDVEGDNPARFEYLFKSWFLMADETLLVLSQGAGGEEKSE
jgi:hypothetical protein